jgi:response regulator RpfG family c-di-GMP phosphodiesterase
VNGAGQCGPGRLRLAELVAALSLGVDLGFGQPMEHVLRQCMIALRLADFVGLDDEERSVVYYTALLVNVGCHSDAYEQAKWFGDDIAAKSGKYSHELGSASGALAALRLVGSGNPPLHRFRVGLEFAVSGRRDLMGMIVQHAALARGLAEKLGLSPSVQMALGAAYEQWNGKGWPGALKGKDIPVASKLAQIGECSEVAHRVGGTGAAVALVDKRAGSQFDPVLAATFCANAEAILDGLHTGGTWEAVIGSEPALGANLSPAESDAALLAVGDFVDLKSPYTLGHGRAVSELAAAAGTKLGLSEAEVVTLRRAGVVHGLGRLGVSNAIWDKRGPLGAGERERVRMHPYLTERMLHQSPALAPLGSVAVQLRERLDGSGYPRGLSGAVIPLPARVLGSADAYHSMREPRPPSRRAQSRTGRPGVAGGGHSGTDGRRRGRGRPGCRRPSGRPAPRRPVRAHLQGGRRAPARLARLVEQRDRRPAGHLAQDRAQPHRAHLREDRSV